MRGEGMITLQESIESIFQQYFNSEESTMDAIKCCQKLLDAIVTHMGFIL
jgi:hypothetical protein